MSFNVVQAPGKSRAFDVLQSLSNSAQSHVPRSAPQKGHASSEAWFWKLVEKMCWSERPGAKVIYVPCRRPKPGLSHARHEHYPRFHRPVGRGETGDMTVHEAISED